MRILGVFLFFVFVSVNAKEEKEHNNFKYYEEVVTAFAPMDVGFFQKNIQQVAIVGLLHTPTESPRPHPLLIFSHGSQDGGVEFQYSGRLPIISRLYLEKGYAVFLPIRKGFNIKGMPPSEVRADNSEPVSCNNYSSSEAGLKSAIADTVALVEKLKSREDIDLQKITLMGQSRGGFLSLALAAEGMPGVVSVINFSGGWYSENCFGAFNSSFFEKFGKKIKVPIISLYGDSDRYYPISHIRHNLGFLDKSGSHTSHIFPGAPHSFLGRTQLWIPFVFK